ncbi:shikimate dehydrogenase [Lentibacillus saliphilus]|uniref:shikimate dehydrogenase n=1 Tax=Lentibacillus saliphilus TaxID=2737028 RepID=UPI001C2FF275|nr:shikimate dehydrogenase [Lentibacillus saliphilus]
MVLRLGLIGHPIQHSFSPWIHQHFLKQIAVKGSYRLKNIAPDCFNEQTVSSAKAELQDGFNVTVPYKRAIMPYLDQLDERAARVGAVNTVVHQNGKWIGYNTDGIGYIKGLQEAYPAQTRDMSIRILVIGAGGAARAIYDALIVQQYEYIDIANRTLEAAEQLATELASSGITTRVMSLEAAEKELSRYDLIIQTTTMGMKPGPEHSVIALERMKQAAIASDIVYQPIHTAFLKEAGERGGNIHYGHHMLLYQAQYAFKLWTGHWVKLGSLPDRMKRQLER